MNFIQRAIAHHVKVDVPVDLIETVAAPLAVGNAVTRATAMHFMRSSLAEKLVGPTMAKQLSLKVLAEVADMPVPLLSDADLLNGCQADLVASLRSQHCEDDADGLERPTKRLRRNAASKSQTLADSTSTVLYALKHHVGSSAVRSTINDAVELVNTMGDHDVNTSGGGAIASYTAFARHLLVLDGAVDRWMAEELFRKRESGAFAGVALATDESPPSQPRFRGLRFQITVMYIGAFDTLDSWERAAGPPMSPTTMLADIAHCPGKTGTDVSRVLEKQLARVGLNPFDVVGAVGDGGGENEGGNGIHSYFEALSPGYVRRRCLPHMAWRTGDMAIRESGLDYRALAAYFVDGITWARLRAIATKSVDDGGLNLFRDGSRACMDIFGKSPEAIAETRPDTDLKFLQFLKGKEHVLYDLARRDVAQREALKQRTKDAVANLGDVAARIGRAILCEVLHRSFWLLRWNGKHSKVAAATSWDELIGQAQGVVMDLELTDKAVLRLGSTPEAVAALATRPKTWVHLCIYEIVGNEDLVHRHLEQALDFHRKVTSKAASHVALLGVNTLRTPWLAAKLLSCDKAIANAAAATLVRHLASTRPGNRTLFEQHLFDTEHLYKQLVAFSQADPPVLLWHGHGSHEGLFKFLAPGSSWPRPRVGLRTNPFTLAVVLQQGPPEEDAHSERGPAAEALH